MIFALRGMRNRPSWIPAPLSRRGSAHKRASYGDSSVAFFTAKSRTSGLSFVCNARW